MTQDDVIEMAREAKLPNSDLYHGNLKTFANLVAAKERENWPAEMKAMENQVNILTDELGKAVWAYGEAVEKTNARANASWTLMCKKMVALEREAVIQIIKETPFSNWFQADVIEAIRARGEV